MRKKEKIRGRKRERDGERQREQERGRDRARERDRQSEREFEIQTLEIISLKFLSLNTSLSIRHYDLFPFHPPARVIAFQGNNLLKNIVIYFVFNFKFNTKF